MRQFIAGLSVSFAFIVGCLAGRIDTDSSAVAAPEAPTGATQTRTTRPSLEYYCFVARDNVTAKMNRMAINGWRLVAGTIHASDETIRENSLAWCMERPYEPNRQERFTHPDIPARY